MQNNSIAKFVVISYSDIQAIVYRLSQYFSRQSFSLNYIIQYSGPMKLTTANPSSKKRFSYQEYRNKAKASLLLSSTLLSAINQLQQQMKAYQIIKCKGRTQVPAQSLCISEASSKKRCFKENSSTQICKTMPQIKLFISLQTVKEFQPSQTPEKKLQKDGKSNLLNDKRIKTTVKAGLHKGVNGSSKRQIQQTQKLKVLKSKTQQLQQQLLQAFSSDLAKRKIINTQFSLIFQLFIRICNTISPLAVIKMDAFIRVSYQDQVFQCATASNFFFEFKFRIDDINKILHELRSQLGKIKRKLNNQFLTNHFWKPFQKQPLGAIEKSKQRQYFRPLVQKKTYQAYGNDQTLKIWLQQKRNRTHNFSFTQAKFTIWNRVSNRHLSDQSGKVFLKVFSALIVQNWVHFRFQPNEHAVEQQKEIQLLKQSLLRRLVFEHERIRIQPLSQGTILCHICYTVSSHVCQQESGHSFCVQCKKSQLKQNLRSDNFFVKSPEYENNDLVCLRTVKKMLKPNDYKLFVYLIKKMRSK